MCVNCRYIKIIENTDKNMTTISGNTNSMYWNMWACHVENVCESKPDEPDVSQEGDTDDEDDEPEEDRDDQEYDENDEEETEHEPTESRWAFELLFGKRGDKFLVVMPDATRKNTDRAVQFDVADETLLSNYVRHTIKTLIIGHLRQGSSKNPCIRLVVSNYEGQRIALYDSIATLDARTQTEEHVKEICQTLWKYMKFTLHCDIVPM